MEIGEELKLQEIEDAVSRFKICPKCNSAQGFWLELKGDHPVVQCKECGAKFELFEVYMISKESKILRGFKSLRRKIGFRF